MAAKTSKIYKAIKACSTEVLTGTLVSIDPSTGSKSSMPGYAVFINGELIESGTIQINPALPRNQKLYEINRVLREEFPYPDVVAVEDIPPVRFGGRKGLDARSLSSLQRAVGAISCAFNLDNFIEVHPRSWQFAKPPEYQKTDEWDAICIGLCCIRIAEDIQNESK